MQKLRYGWFLLSALLLNGCTSVAPFKGIAMDDETVYISGLPPIRQDGHYACGAACVAAVAAFWHIPLAEFRSRHQSLPADLTGQELQILAKDLGLQAYAYRGSLEDLQENLKKGRPLIVMIPQPLIPTADLTSKLLINAWNNWGAKPAHWVVVVGLTPNKTVIIHDPASGPITVKLETFETWWSKKGNLTVLIAGR